MKIIVLLFIFLICFTLTSFAEDNMNWQGNLDKMDEQIEQLQNKIQQETNQLKTLDEQAQELTSKVQTVCVKDENGSQCMSLTQQFQEFLQDANELKNRFRQDQDQLRIKLIQYHAAD